jgi:hypothetical protein
VTEVVSDWAQSIAMIILWVAVCIAALALAIGLVLWIAHTVAASWLDLKIRARKELGK